MPPYRPTAEQAQEAGRIIVSCRIPIVEKAGGTIKRIAEEYALIAFSDPASYSDIDESGAMALRSFKAMGKKRRALKKVREKTVITESADGQRLNKISTVEYELWDKLSALNGLMDLRGDKIKKLEVTGANGGPLTHKLLAGLSDDELARIARGGSSGTAPEAPSTDKPD